MAATTNNYPTIDRDSLHEVVATYLIQKKDSAHTQSIVSVALSIIVALAGFYVVFSSLNMFPAGLNSLSQFGVQGAFVGGGTLAVAVILFIYSIFQGRRYKEISHYELSEDLNLQRSYEQEKGFPLVFSDALRRKEIILVKRDEQYDSYNLSGAVKESETLQKWNEKKDLAILSLDEFKKRLNMSANK